MSDRYVLDASAVLAALQGEAGGEIVEKAIGSSVIGTVNVAEVAGKLADGGLTADEIAWSLRALALDTVPLSAETAVAAGALRPATADAGLSLGDRACLALAIELGVPALTADRRWAAVRTKAKVKVLR